FNPRGEVICDASNSAPAGRIPPNRADRVRRGNWPAANRVIARAAGRGGTSTAGGRSPITRARQFMRARWLALFPTPLMTAFSFSSSPRWRGLRLGFVPLSDAAPLIMAHELGLFARFGLDVHLQREVGWATIRERVIQGELDGAQAPAPMLWSTQLGCGCAPADVLTAFVLNRHGNGITLAQKLWDDGVRDGASLRINAHRRRARERLTLA